MDCNSVATFLSDIADESFELGIKVFVIADQVLIATLEALDVAKEVTDLSASMKDIAEELKRDAAGTNNPIVNIQCLCDIMVSANSCQILIQGLQYDMQKVGEILRRKGIDAPRDVKLSRAERARWPFSQPQTDGFIDDLKAENGKLFSILLVIRLARSRQAAELNKNSTPKIESQDYLADAINITQRWLQKDQHDKPSEMNASGQDKWKHVRAVQRDDNASREVNLGTKSSSDPNPTNDPYQSSEGLNQSKAHTSPPDTGFREPSVPHEVDPDQVHKHDKEISMNKVNDGKTGLPRSDKPLTTSDFTASEGEKEMEGVNKVLQLHFLRPLPGLWDSAVGVRYYYTCQASISQGALADEVARMKLGPMSLVDQLTQLTAYEDSQLRDFLYTLPPEAVLVSVHKEEPKDHHFHSITIRGACGIRVIIETFNPKNRPMYIKCHINHLDPRTLDEYNLPWTFDKKDPNYIIIKRWVPEKDQDTLFEHTRLIRERERLRKPRLQLRSRGLTKFDRREVQSEDESDYGRNVSSDYDSDKEHGRRIIIEKKGTSKAFSFDSAKEGPQDEYDFAKELLAKYTTLSASPKETSTAALDEPKVSVDEPTLHGKESKLSGDQPASDEPRLPAKQPLASPNGRMAEKYEFV